MKRSTPRIAAAFSRLVLGSYFHRIEVVGEHRVPREGPVLFVANHNNGLVDPLLILGLLPRRPRFLAKSVLWRNPLLGLLFDAAGVIPVFRPQDAGGDVQDNQQTFSRCFEVLGGGGAIAIFPEGRSHDEPSLSALRTGAARIALGAEERFGPLGLSIVPVGLIFERKETFRTRALMVVSPPLAVDEESSPNGVRALTARIDDALRSVSHDWASWDDAYWVARAQAIAGRPATAELPATSSMAESFEREKSFGRGLTALRGKHDETLDRLREALERYDRSLRLLGLRDDQVVARYPVHSVLSYLGETLLRLALRLPFALLGVGLSYLPYRTCGWAAGRFADAPDEVASYKVYTALLFYPAFWGLEAAALGWALGWRWALVVALLAPFCSYLSLDFRDRRSHLFREARAFLRLREGSVVERLRSERQEVLREIEGVLDLHASLEAGRERASS